MNDALKEAHEYDEVLTLRRETEIKSGFAPVLKLGRAVFVYISTQQVLVNEEKKKLVVAQVFHPQKCFGVGISSQVAVYECIYNLINLLKKSGS